MMKTWGTKIFHPPDEALNIFWGLQVFWFQQPNDFFRSTGFQLWTPNILKATAFTVAGTGSGAGSWRGWPLRACLGANCCAVRAGAHFLPMLFAQNAASWWPDLACCSLVKTKRWRLLWHERTELATRNFKAQVKNCKPDKISCERQQLVVSSRWKIVNCQLGFQPMWKPSLVASHV